MPLLECDLADLMPWLLFVDLHSLSKEDAESLKDWLKGVLLNRVNNIKVSVRPGVPEANEIIWYGPSGGTQNSIIL